MELEMYRRYSQMARGIEKAELVFKNGRVFSSGTGEFIDGDVAVADGIVRLRPGPGAAEPGYEPLLLGSGIYRQSSASGIYSGDAG